MKRIEPLCSFGQEVYDGLVMTRPVFLDRADEMRQWLSSKSYDELKGLWNCSDNIAAANVEQLTQMDLSSALTPAIIAYDGIAYTYMAPSVFEDGHYSYVQDHLRILSGFYGVLKAMDGVTPYRLEMQTKAAPGDAGNLYDYWGRSLYDAVTEDDSNGTVIINLASKEYSRCIEKYLSPADTFITCKFVEAKKVSEKDVQYVIKATYAKMARGEMVRYMAEHRITDPEALKGFNRLGYRYHEGLSDGAEYVFVKG